MSRAAHNRHLRPRPTPSGPAAGGSPRACVTPGQARWVCTLVLAAMAMSIYLLMVSVSGGATAGCGPDSSCHAVLSSRWAHVFGLPVSALAVGVDAGLLLCLWLARAAAPTGWRVVAETGLALCATLVAGAAVWFTFAQVWLIGAVCPYCLTAHACGLGAAGILLPRLLTGSTEPTTGPRHPVAVAAGLGAVGLLVASQFLYEPATHRVTAIPLTPGEDRRPQTPAVPGPAVSAPVAALDGEAGVSAPGAAGVASTNPPAPLARRWLSFHGGAFAFDLHEIPVLGSPNAPYVVGSLFDYTCDHCRVLHHHLAEVLRAFTNELAVACLPVPLNTNCNRLVRRNSAANSNACDYAELALAVWRTNRAQFRAFDAWLFEGAAPPPVEAARERAEGLVGLEALPQALADPWIKELIRRDVELYARNAEVTGSTRMPQLMLGSRISEGRMRATEDLYQLLEAHLGLTRAEPAAPLPAAPP